MLPSLLTFLAAASLTAAQVTTSTYTISNCFTSYDRVGSNRTSIPTIFNVRTTTGQGFARGIITPIVSVTPAISTTTTTTLLTRTVSVTAPSLPPSGTATVTTTFTISTTLSTTSTFTSTVPINSTTTLTGTTTIPTQSGFTPVAVGLIAQSQVPSRLRFRPRANDINNNNLPPWPANPALRARTSFDRLLLELGAAAPPFAPAASSSSISLAVPLSPASTSPFRGPNNNNKNGGGGGRGNRCMFRHDARVDPAQETGVGLYPPLDAVAVDCSVLVREDVVRVFTKTARVTSTVTAAAETTTVTATGVTTSTTTVGSVGGGGAGTVTVGVTTTAVGSTTVVSTTFSTITNTFTVNAPLETEWAACAQNNVVSLVNGNPIAAGAQNLLVQMMTSGPTDCCNMCQMTNDCTTSAYYDGSNVCMLGNGTGTQTNEIFTTEADDQPIFYVSNGRGEPSGDWYFGGLLD